jgi:hypothetical protein
LAEIWTTEGHQISVRNGPVGRHDANIIINHVDLTVVPEDHLAFINAFPKAINARVGDISKRTISKYLVRQGDGYGGPVIIKTNRNYGGYMEGRLASAGLIPAVKLCHPNKYPILKSPNFVPPALWNDLDFVVERFLPEIIDRSYCVRTWVFFGDRETHSLCYSKVPIVKSENVFRREGLSPADVPEELRKERRRLGFDFGKFDYTLVEDKPVLFDVNRTPSVGSFPREEYMPRIRLLAEGLKSFIRS